MSEMMRAAYLREDGGIDKVQIEDIPIPEPAAGEVLVRVAAAALNHRDVFITQGLYRDVRLPVILGSDGAGELEGGERVVINPLLEWGNDERVWSSRANILGMPRAGTFAEFVCVPKENVTAMPEALSFEEAAAIPLGGLTAYRALVVRGELQKGETVLITGVGGGVQSFTLLFAKKLGARVIVTSGSDEKLARAKALGADVTINYRTDSDWFKTARAAGPIDLVVDSTGGETLSRAIVAVRPGGRVVMFGGTTGETSIRPFTVFWNHVDIRGTSMGSSQDFAAMLKVFESGLRPVVDSVYDLEDIGEAMHRMEEAEQFGKIVIRI